MERIDENKKTIAEMRHEVIDNTIKIEILLDDIIQIDMGFEPNYQEINEHEQVISNIQDIFKFRKFFLDRTSLDKKFSIVKEIIKEDNKKVIPNDLWENAKKIREIRNKFAHTLAPEYPSKQGLTGPSSSFIDSMTKEIELWENLYIDHSKAFEEIYDNIWNMFYQPLK